MPWYDRIVPESIKKNVCAYLLQRYLGQFFEEKLTRDQLNVDLYNGTGTVEKISLDVQALNELSEKQNWPMEFVDGFIENLYVRIPWSAILKDPSFVEVRGLKLTVQPKQRHEAATSMFESMWNSMTSSMQLAEECAKQDAANLANNAQTYEGIEIFAQTIDSILSRVKVKFIDTIIQIEHVPKDSSTGVGILINIEAIDYSDEAGNDPPNSEATDLTNQDSNKAYLVQSFTTKKLIIQGVTLSTVEFSSKARTFSRSVINQSQYYEKENDDSFTALISVQDDDDDNFYATKGETNDNDGNFSENFLLNDERHVIMFGKISGKQEIRVRLKQSENLVGPKVSIEMNLGSLTVFLSPRQFHVLIELANGLASPDIEDTSNVAPRTTCTAKPMSPIDYQRVEQELQQQLHPLSNFQMAGLQGVHGWSTAALDESDTDDNFLPMKNTVSAMYDSTLSAVSSSMDSSVSSSMNSSVTEQTSRTRRRINNIDSDPTAEISHFQIRIASLALILLHEDLLVQQQDYLLAPSSVKQMQQTVEDFFKNVGHFILTAYGNKDFENARGVFEKACTLNHLRLLAAPVQIEGDEKTTLTAFSISGHLTAAKLELLECIYHLPVNTEYVPLLVFNNNSSTSTLQQSPSTAKPSFKLTFRHIERTSKTISRRNIGPKTDITITLNKCDMEFDITIIDRITALLNPQPICVIEKNQYNPWNNANLNKPANINVQQTESKIDLKLISSSINLKLRFPVPDFRPTHDMNRVPWWKRHVRPDYLSLILSDCTFRTCFQTNETHREYTIECRALDIFYYETEKSVGIPVAKAGFDDKYASSMQDVLLQSRLDIKIFPVKKIDLDDTVEPEVDPMMHSVYGAFENQGIKMPGPFSAKRVVHESDTPHSKPQKDDSEELIIPGDKQEMDDFVNETSVSTRIHVDVVLPTLSLQLQSKHIYELIYNRINNDLLLWETSAPKPKTNLFYDNVNLNVDAGPDVFSMCKSGIQYESESDTDDESDQGSNIFYSTYDKSVKYTQKQTQINNATLNRTQSNFVMNIKIAQGLVSLFTPVRDVATNNVIPNQQGEFLLNVDDANIFIVSGYKGDSNLGFVCVQIHKADLHHCNMISMPNVGPSIKEIGSAIGRHLNNTIYKSEPGMLDNSNNSRGGSREMFTVAVRVQANHETHHVKTVRVALGLNKATLRHRICNSSNSWISHLLDFFNVQDYPIPGYHAKDVLTELHLHLWDCAIDYRPLYLPLRAALCLGNFSMSSHLSAQANSSTLHFIAEECGLFLSEVGVPKNGIASMAPVDLKRDYVNVIDVGLFELSLKINDKKSGINPHIDLRASNNIINIHTCSDSGRALMQLITYFANDGDLLQNEDIDDKMGSFSSTIHKTEEELISMETQDISNLSISQHQQVNALLGEAMNDEQLEENVEILQNTGAKLFFFPDENNQITVAQEALAKPLPQVTAELGDVTTVASNKSSDTDDDFCFIGNEAGLGKITNNGLPDIKWLTNDPIRLIDNHFTIPIGKTDLLKPPKDYPTPIFRYTLCEMSIIWHMYGGNDFKVPQKENQKKTVNFSDTTTQLNDVVSYSNSQKGHVSFKSLTDKKKNNMPWLVRGGVNRNHDVLMEFQLNKIRFQHDVYPDTTKQASRQVLIVSDLEIRDRLKSSKFNKFLYQYTSQARPKQSHAHMIVIKANHIRPDPKLKTQECCLKVSILPLRFNIDQDSLMFLIAFFSELGGDYSIKESENTSSKHNTPTHQPPVMTVNEENEKLNKEQAQTMVDDNLLILLEESKSIQESKNVTVHVSNSNVDSLPIYFRSVIFSPEVPIRLDYTGKHVDGSLSGLLLGLGQLDCSELRLKRICHRHGLLGFDKLASFLLHEWLSDIKKNQLPNLLGGVGPIHSFIQLFQGIRDLFWLPIEQYQKDGRIVRGLQRGANSFTTSTAMAALELTSRIIHLIQITAETAYDMLSPGPSLKRIAKSKGKRKKYHQPQDIREGMANAYALVKEGIGETADNIVQVASHEHEQKGYSGAVGGVLRQIPPTFIKPIIIASEATSNVLGGMRSQLVPDARREANEKWRNPEE